MTRLNKNHIQIYRILILNITLFALYGCSNWSNSSSRINYHGFPEDEINTCIQIHMKLNDMQLVRIVSIDETDDFPGLFTANVYIDVVKKENFRSLPETIRVKMPLIFDNRGKIIGSSVEEIN